METQHKIQSGVVEPDKPDHSCCLHTPVLLKEVIGYLKPKGGGIYLDCTVGLGGHASAILELSSPDGRLIGIDLDRDAIAIAEKNLARFQHRVTLIHGNFANLDKVLERLGISEVDGILMDLGVSSLQLETPHRGFSFLKPGPLDMRMDRDIAYTAEHELNTKSKEELTEIFYKFGEEKWAKVIASKIVKCRNKQAITNTLQLADIIEKAIPKASKTKIHPATRVFQALRIHVNGELNNLELGLKNAVRALKQGGVICAISFHSLEDRIVKRTFRFLSSKCICPPEIPVCVCNHKPSLKLLTKQPMIPQKEELQRNPRARSAKLRAAVALP